MTKKITVIITSIAFCFLGISNIMAQSTHDHKNHSHQHEESMTSHDHDHGPMPSEQTPYQAKLLTGQGEFKFSWDKKLTAAFPKEAQEFEPGMHGGFNEDPETGIVYTGIPGYGLCSISPDLTTWKSIGTDIRLKDNIHGIAFFIHKKVKYLAVAQEGKRVLVLTLDGVIVSEIVKPKGTEFKFFCCKRILFCRKKQFRRYRYHLFKGNTICISRLF